MKKFFTELYNRWFNCTTPEFFKKVSKVGAMLAAVGGAIVGPSVAGVHVSHTILHIAENLMVAGGAMIAVAQATQTK